MASSGEIGSSLAPVSHCNGQFGRECPSAGSDTIPPREERLVTQPGDLVDFASSPLRTSALKEPSHLGKAPPTFARFPTSRPNLLKEHDFQIGTFGTTVMTRPSGSRKSTVTHLPVTASRSRPRRAPSNGALRPTPAHPPISTMTADANQRRPRIVDMQGAHHRNGERIEQRVAG